MAEIDKERRAWYDKRANRNVKQVVPPKGGDRMTTMEVLTLLLLLATVIFGILGYIKK